MNPMDLAMRLLKGRREWESHNERGQAFTEDLFEGLLHDHDLMPYEEMTDRQRAIIDTKMSLPAHLFSEGSEMGELMNRFLFSRSMHESIPDVYYEDELEYLNHFKDALESVVFPNGAYDYDKAMEISDGGYEEHPEHPHAIAISQMHPSFTERQNTVSKLYGTDDAEAETQFSPEFQDIYTGEPMDLTWRLLKGFPYEFIEDEDEPDPDDPSRKKWRLDPDEQIWNDEADEHLKEITRQQQDYLWNLPPEQKLWYIRAHGDPMLQSKLERAMLEASDENIPEMAQPRNPVSSSKDFDAYKNMDPDLLNDFLLEAFLNSYGQGMTSMGGLFDREPVERESGHWNKEGQFIPSGKTYISTDATDDDNHNRIIGRSHAVDPSQWRKFAGEPMDIAWRLLKAPMYETGIPGIRFVTQGEDEADWRDDPTVHGTDVGAFHFVPQDAPQATVDDASTVEFIQQMTPNEFLSRTPPLKNKPDSYYRDLMDRAQAGENIKFSMPHLSDFYPMEDKEMQLMGRDIPHDGRHRMAELVARGHGDTPVPIRRDLF